MPDLVIQWRPRIAAAAALALLLASSAGAKPAAPLDCIRTGNPDAFLPQGAALAPPVDAAAGCSPSGRSLACAPSAGDDAAAPADPRLLDFDRVCESLDCGSGAGPAATAVRVAGRQTSRVRELALSCRLIAQPDDQVPVGEGRGAASHAMSVTCGDFTGEGNKTASDALGALRTAVGSASCLVCVCDVNLSGGVTSSDALLILRFSVGQAVALTCPDDNTPIAWDAGGDGVNWTDAMNWSLDRIPHGCDAVTLATGSVVHNTGNHFVRSITASVPFDISGGKLDVRDSVTSSGLMRMKGGTLSRAHVLAPGNGADFVMTTSAGTLEAVSVAADLDLSTSSANIYATGGLTLDGTATLGPNASILFPVSPKVSLDGTGEVLMQSANSYLYNFSGAALSIGADLLIHGSAGNVGGTQSSTTLATAATIDADGGGTIAVGPPSGTWSNSGLLRATSGTLQTTGTWTSTGTIAVETTGTLNLGGNFASATFGAFDRDGGTVNLTGMFDVSSGFTLDAGTGSWRLLGGTIKNGTLGAEDGAKIIFTTSGGTLSNLVLNADMDLGASSSNVYATNGLTLNGVATLGPNASMLFPVSPEVSLDGTGEVLMQNPNAYIYNFSGAALSIGADLLIHGSAGSVGGTQAATTMATAATIDADGGGTITVGPPSGTWSNSGLLRASNGTLTTTGAWSNTGTIALEPTGVLNLGGSFASGTFGTFDRDGGTVNLTGMFDVGSGFTLDASTGNWRLVGGTIKNGTLGAEDGAKIVYTTSGGTLTNVVMNADMDLGASSSNVYVTSGLTLNGVATLGPNASILFPVSPEVSLDGTGEVLMQNANAFLYNFSGAALTIGADLLIHGSAGNVGGTQGSTTMTTAATIDSDGGGTITVGPPSGTWSNSGLLRASNGTLTTAGTWTSTGTIAVETTGTLNLGGSFASATFGTFDRDGGTVNVTGSFDVTTTFTLDSGTGNWRLVGGTIKNGTLGAEDGAKLIGATSYGTLSDLVMNADLDLTASSTAVYVTNGLTLNGKVTLGTNASMLFPVSPEVSLGGTGEVLMQHANAFIYNFSGAALSIGPDVLIHGSAGNIGGTQGATTMTTAATIDSDAGGSLTVGPPSGTWTNTGLLAASAGNLVTMGSWSNGGDIHIGAGRLLTAGSGFTQSGAGELTIDIGGTAANQFGKVAVTGAAALGGTLNIALVDAFVPTLGNTFQVMTFGSSSGTFATVTGTDIAGPNRFAITTNAGDLVLSVVPD